MNHPSFRRFRLPVIAGVLTVLPGLAMATPPRNPPPNPAAASSIDPFKGQSAAYENLLNQTRTTQLKRKLMQNKLEIVRYQAKIRALEGASAPGQSGASNSALQALQSKMNALESKVAKLERAKPAKASAATDPHSAARPASTAMTRPVLTGIVSTASGRSAWFRQGKTVTLAHDGQKVGAWRVDFVGSRGVILSAPRHGRHVLLPFHGWAGQAVVAIPTVAQGSQATNGVAPGSTPSSSNAFETTGANRVIQALTSRN